MTALSTAAWVSHDMALAAGLGGTLFKQFALPTALNRVTDNRQRGHVLASAYKHFAPASLTSLGLIAGTWLAGRAFITGRSIGRNERIMVNVKDGLIAGAIATGIAGVILDRRLEEEADRGRVGIRGMNPTDESSPRGRNLLRAVQAIGAVNTLCLAGALGLTTVLAMRAGRSMKWSFVSRLLP